VRFAGARAERVLRKIVVVRKAWVFYGSDTHAEAAAAPSIDAWCSGSCRNRSVSIRSRRQRRGFAGDELGL
jgi:hypothetical protein